MSLLNSLFSKPKKETYSSFFKLTKQRFFSPITQIINQKTTIDSDVLDQLEETLLSADVGVKTTLKIIQRLEDHLSKKSFTKVEWNSLVYEEINSLFSDSNTSSSSYALSQEGQKPYVIMVVGVNGVGKTTTVGKLAAQFKKQNKSVMLGAADTFRAAAVEQLQQWGSRIGVPVVVRKDVTSPSAIAYETLKQGIADSTDILIIDTAGRLHTKVNLMQELVKTKRVIQKMLPQAPHEIMLVVDGSTGQNAILQAQEFIRSIDVTSLAVTKLDGTAKGGIIIGISSEFNIPVRFIGTGEKVDDIQPFDKTEFIHSLFDPL